MSDRENGVRDRGIVWGNVSKDENPRPSTVKEFHLKTRRRENVYIWDE